MPFHPSFCETVLGHSRLRGNEIADELAIEGTVNQFVGPEPALGVSRQITRKKIKCWLYNQRMAIWRDLVSTETGPKNDFEP